MRLVSLILLAMLSAGVSANPLSSCWEKALRLAGAKSKFFVQHPSSLRVIRYPGEEHFVVLARLEHPNSVRLLEDPLLPVERQEQLKLRQLEELSRRDERRQAIRDTARETSKFIAMAGATILVGHTVVVLKESSLDLLDHLFFMGMEGMTFVGSTAVHHFLNKHHLGVLAHSEDLRVYKSELLQQIVSTVRLALADKNAPVVVGIPGELFEPTVDFLFKYDRIEIVTH